MPEKRTTQRAKTALRRGKKPTTAAGAFVHEEIEHAREGKHGVKSTKQTVAIGLSKARRAGVPVPPKSAKTAKKTAPHGKGTITRKRTTTATRKKAPARTTRAPKRP